MHIHTWHVFGVIIPYVLIATALWGLLSGAVKDAVRLGSLPNRVPLRMGQKERAIPAIPLAYVLGFITVAFIYACVLDRRHMQVAIGMDPHEVAAGADAVLYVLAGMSWLSASVLVVAYRWLRRATYRLLKAPRDQQAMEERYRLLANNMTDFVSHHGTDYRYEWASPSASTILGYSPAELVGTDPYDLIHPEDGKWLKASTDERHRQQEDGGAAIVRYRIRHRQGHYIWLESVAKTLTGEGGEIVGFQVSSRDVTERQMMEEELHHRAYHDPLTGLANRALFNLRLDSLVEQVRQGERRRPYAVLYVDLDKFKAINDTFGHAAGDAVLVDVAARLQEAARDGDTVARIGGDEFAIILERVHTETEALRAAGRIGHAVREPFKLGEQEFLLSASIGVTMGRSEHATSGDLLREADLAAYAAKTESAGRAHFFTPSLKESNDRRLRLERDLRDIAERGELRVVYQPLVCLEDHRLIGFEALVRWQHPTLGLLYPDAFISLAEETGLIGEVDRWVLDEGLRHLLEWEEAAGRELDLALSVNCSGYNIRERGFSGVVHHLLRGREDAADRLILEITESLLVEDPNRVAKELEELRRTGLRFALDDFGTGYSSLSTIHALPIDIIKVDRAFVQRMEEDSAAHGLVRTVLQLGSVVGATVLAEGIETEAQFESLKKLGCDFGQGYLFARPLSPEDAFRLVQLEGARWDGHWTSDRDAVRNPARPELFSPRLPQVPTGVLTAPPGRA